jgi:hypothetical protein
VYLNNTGDPEERFSASGGLSLVDAIITGALTCERGVLTGKSGSGSALAATRLRVSGGVNFAGLSTAAGAVHLTDADITGPLSFRDAVLKGTDDDGCALRADGLKVSSGAYLDRLEADGAVTLLDARITGQLSFRGATINGERREQVWNGWRMEPRPQGVSFSGDRLTATGGAWFDGGFTATRAVRLSGAQITGMLAFHAAQLNGTDPTGSSLIADGITVSRGVYLAAGFVSAGALVLSDANISGQLVVGQPSRLANVESSPDKDVYLNGVDEDGYSLVATRMALTGDAQFERFASAGALGLKSATISGQLRWAPGERPEWALDLSEASASRLSDDGNWPTNGQLQLAGFTYDGFAADSQLPWRHRLEWIRGQYPPSLAAPRQPPEPAPTRYSAQPYEQLASVYSQTGHDDDAREINIAALRDRRQFGQLSKPSKLLNLTYDITIRYGYRSWLAAVYLVALFVIMFAAFSLAQSGGSVIVPAGDVTGLHPAPTASRCQSDYPCFSPAGFALDIVVPIINVHQPDNWRVNRHSSWGWAWMLAAWLATLLGWAFVTLFVAGYTGLVRLN